MSRRMVRTKVVQALYELHFQPQAIDRIIDDQQEKLSTDDFSFFHQILTGIQQEARSIDQSISRYLKKGWSINRISLMERSILRLSIYELIFLKEAPPKVVINEAVELAKQFGDDHSGRFINGILGNLIREVEEKESK